MAIDNYRIEVEHNIEHKISVQKREIRWEEQKLNRMKRELSNLEQRLEVVRQDV